MCSFILKISNLNNSNSSPINLAINSLKSYVKIKVYGFVYPLHVRTGKGCMFDTSNSLTALELTLRVIGYLAKRKVRIF